MSYRLRDIAIVVLYLLAVFAAGFYFAGILIPKRAAATDLDWSLSGSSYHAPRKPHRVRRHRKVERGETVVRLYRSMDDHEFHCGGPTRGLGTQWIGTEGAMDAAKKDWMERVRYDLGEAFLDLSHATDFVSRCGRTSIGETMGQVMYRCEIIARPCKGTFTEGDAAKKD